MPISMTTDTEGCANCNMKIKELQDKVKILVDEVEYMRKRLESLEAVKNQRVEDDTITDRSADVEIRRQEGKTQQIKDVEEICDKNKIIISNTAKGTSSITVIKDFLTQSESQILLDKLTFKCNWQGGSGIPRLIAWYGPTDYRYGKIHHTKCNDWPEELRILKKRVEEALGKRFNSAVVNLYRNERDMTGWHSDDEPGVNEHIASISLGDTRLFELRRKDAMEVRKITLKPGTLLLMEGETQKDWQHRIPRETTRKTARINITFRTMETEEEGQSVGPSGQEPHSVQVMAAEDKSETEHSATIKEVNGKCIYLVGDSILKGTGNIFCKQDRWNRTRICLPGAKIEDVTKVVKGLKNDGGIIYVQVGTNDVARGNTEEVMKNYRTLLEEVMKRGSDIRIMEMEPRFDRPELLNRVLSINMRLERLCKEMNIRYVHTWNIFMKNRRLYSKDGLHMSKEGARTLAKILEENVISTKDNVEEEMRDGIRRNLVETISKLSDLN